MGRPMPDVFQQEHASTDQLSALLDNRAEPAEAPFLTQHLGSCDACAAELGSLRGVRDLLRALPVHLPPRSFTIQEDPIPLRPSRLIPITRVLGALAAVFCAILVAMDALGTTNPQTAPLAGLSVPSQSDTAAKPAAAGGAVRSEAPAPAPAAPAPQ